MPLKDVEIRNARPGVKTRKLSDGEGLQLHISPANGRSWKLAYRFNGKQRELTIGDYPTISLQEARQRRDAAKRQLADGIDPSAQRKLDAIAKANADATTFAAVAAELLARKRREGKAANTLSKLEWLHGLANEGFGERPISAITAPEVLAVLRKVEAKGRLETAKRLRAVIGEVFRFAVATARAGNDPTSALRGAIAAPVVKHRAAITDPIALGGLLRAIEGFKGQPATNAALKLMAYLFPRPGELRMAEWKEFDLVNAVWTIPAARAKMRREHRIPLPRQALAILAELKSVTGGGALGFRLNHSQKATTAARAAAERKLAASLS